MTFKSQSEEFVFNVAQHSFLSLWSYANPLKEPAGKELCDILTVFSSNVAIFSVKESKLKSTTLIDLERWRRRAIESSTKQIYGAEKIIRSSTHIIRSDGSQGLPFPSVSDMQIHRIAVSLGSDGEAPITSRDYGKGFVHVFDEKSFLTIMSELDTAPDFFEYLSKKITFLNHSSNVILEGREEDLLAVYLSNNRQFPTSTLYVSIGAGIWDDFRQRPEYLAKNEANQVSLLWDGLIEYVAGHALTGTLEFGSSLSNVELALRQMASENRYQRRLLGKSFDDFLQQSAKSVQSRLVKSESGAIYVFLAKPLGTSREDRMRELIARCLVAKGKFHEIPMVVGIATEEYIPNQGFSIDLIYILKPQWTDSDQEVFDQIQSNFNYFAGKPNRFNENEYPT